MIAFSRRTIAFSLVLGALLLSARTSAAAELEVDSTRALAEAIEHASDGDIIVLTGDIQLQRYLPRITADITIEGGGHTISGGGKYRIFFVEEGADVTINALNVLDGRADKISIERRPHFKEGGAIVNLHGSLIICNSTFAGNTAEYGGAIVNLGALKICNSRFAGNVAENGGAIYHDAGRLTVENSTFTGNVADWAGGAIFNGGGTVDIGDSKFIGNVAPSGGGAIVIAEYGTVNVSDSAFSSNVASRGNGGAINIWYKSKLTARDCIFQRNFAVAGGAISSLGDLMDIRNCSFVGNKAGGPGGNGGAIQSGRRVGANWQSEIKIIESGFEGNEAEYGGAIFFHGAKSADIRNSTFLGNGAAEGGGLFISAGPVTLAHVTMRNNYADRGGSVYAKDYAEYPQSHAQLRIRNSVIGDGDQRFPGYKSDDCVAEKPNLIIEHVGSLSKDGSCGPGLSGDPGWASAQRPMEGSPAYVSLNADSPAIDAADPKFCETSDQIGNARPQGAGCDIGAIEFTG